MNQLLDPGTKIHINNTCCTVERFIGGGGQGEVYQAKLNNQFIALKWYFPQQATHEQKIALEMLIKNGAPDEKFLWPLGLATSKNIRGFGYIMPLREKRYKSIIDLMKQRIEPSFRSLAGAGLELADSFLQLHSKGLCYRDISFGNVFFDPDTGEVLICDNDNVTFDKRSQTGILGTPRFMAPEVVRGQSRPGTQSDLFSLSVLLFYIFMVHHPLEGKKESEIKCFDLPAMNKLYGTEPVFIFDPHDNSNRPVIGYHDNALIYWHIYPQFLRDIFTKAFTDGIYDPENGRVRETEWRAAMVSLRDSIIYCGECGSENFYDIDILKTKNRLKPCWCCQKEIKAPPRIRIGKNIIMLNHDTQLFFHHIDNQKIYDFSKPVAIVVQHPTNPDIWGIKNLSDEKWVVTNYDNSIKDVKPGKTITMAKGLKINFGTQEGEIRL